jgi:hypothetical protein
MPVSFISVRTKFDSELHALCDPSALEFFLSILLLSPLYLSLSPSLRQCALFCAVARHGGAWLQRH